MRRFFVTLAMIAIVLAPHGASANDRQIAEQIVRSLKQRKAAGELQGFNIDLQVDQGAVWLKGYVSSPEQERIALQIAKGIDGVGEVFNEMEIRSQAVAGLATELSSVPPSDGLMLATGETEVGNDQLGTVRLVSSEEDVDPAQDESRRIAQDLVVKLRAEQKAGNLERFGIDVRVDNGVLWLKGQMASKAQRDLVLETARRIRGVKKVVDELSVKASEPTLARTRQTPEDQEFLAPIASAPQVAEEIIKPVKIAPAVAPETLEQDGTELTESERITEKVLVRLAKQKELGALRDFGIDVQVDDGVVWMSGYVADAQQQTLALNMARYVPGVKQVVNDLKVKQAEEDIDSNVQAVSQPIPSDVPRKTEFESVEQLRPQLVQHTAPAPAAVPAPSTEAAPTAAAQAPAGLSYQPTNAQSQIAGWALVNVNGQQVPGQQMVQPAHNGLQTPMAFAPARPVNYTQSSAPGGQPVPMMGAHGVGVTPARYDHPQLPGYAWPSYAAYPNYGAVTYPRQYSAQAWPYIGPFYPYPQVPLGWRKVTLEWDDGWWHLDFKDRH